MEIVQVTPAPKNLRDRRNKQRKTREGEMTSN